MNTRYRRTRAFICAALTFFLSGPVLGEESKLRVLTSIKPLQLIVKAVTGDLAQVDVLLAASISPHDYQLRPSDRRKLAEADVIFWIGPGMETFLGAGLSALPKHKKVVSLQVETAQTGDPHLWMDPKIAASMGLEIADALSELAPTYARTLHANAMRLESDLMAEDQILREQISAIKSPRGFMVVHDAYSRFESRYGLRHRAALTDISDLPPSAQNIAHIQALLEAGEVSCVLQEPLMPPKILQTLLNGRQIRMEIIDSLASRDSEIVNFYRRIGASVIKCLGS